MTLKRYVGLFDQARHADEVREAVNESDYGKVALVFSS